MKSSGPLFKYTLGAIAAGIWCVLIALMTLDWSNNSFNIILGMTALISTLSATSRLLINDVFCKSRVGRLTIDAITVIIPLLWLMNLFKGQPAGDHGLLLFFTLVPVSAALIPTWLHAQKSENCELASRDADGHPTPDQRHFSFVLECGSSRNVHEESNSTFVPTDYVDETSDSELSTEEWLPDVTQWLTRSQAQEEDIVRGGVRVEFAEGQRDATIHIAFCPPFSQPPTVHAEDLDDMNLNIQVAASFPFGVRLTVRRVLISTVSGIPSVPTSSYRVGFVAISSRARGAA